MREKLIELLESADSAVYWDSSDKNFVEKIADHMIANGVTVSSEIEELRSDNKRLREMWVHTFSELSKCNAEKMKYKKMLDNAYEMIGKITDRWG